MDIEKLWGILYKERNTASLQELPETFCEEVSEYMEKLAEEKGEADERRRELVEEGKEKIFALILGEKEGKSEKMDAEKENGKDAKHFDQTFSKFDEASSPTPVPAKSKNEELYIVRVLEDIPTFMGTDGRIYKVRKEDVIMLPKTNAEILCKRGVAVRFEGKRREEKVSTGGIEK
jgi:DNA replication factor GINS